MDINKLLDRPSEKEIEDCILNIIQFRDVSFPELERCVLKRLPKIEEVSLVRQAIWRLISSHDLKIVRGMKLTLNKDIK